MDLLPPATYTVRVARVHVRGTRAGDPLWGLGFVVDEGPHQGRWIWDNLVFSAKAIERSRKALAALGFPDVPDDPTRLEGRMCCVEVAEEEYQGQARSAISYWGYTPAPESESDLAAPPQPDAAGPGTTATDDTPF